MIDLAEEQEETDRRFIAICERLTEADLERPVALLRRKGRVEEVVHRLLAHVFQHQVHHRGQVHAMLAGTSVAPPQLDEFFCAGDAPLRAAELAELGFSEETIWGRVREHVPNYLRQTVASQGCCSRGRPGGR